MDTTYKKHTGTSGISGQLYETKLISLILFRLQRDDSVEEFHLASNMDDIGAFDDVCLRMKLSGHDVPVFVFLQAKHKEDDNTFLDFDLVKHLYASYQKVKQKCNSSAHNLFFNAPFDEALCLFVLYTNAKWYGNANNSDLNASSAFLFRQSWRPYDNNLAYSLNNMLGTSDRGTQGSQPVYTDQDVQFTNEIILEEEVATLAEHFAKFLNNKTNQSMNIMHDEYISSYHVILAQNVVFISEKQSEVDKPGPTADGKLNDVEDSRILTFRSDFFNTNDKILTILKDKLYKEVIKNHAIWNNSEEGDKTRQDRTLPQSTIDGLISSFILEPSALTLSPLIETHITYKNNKLKFVTDRPNSDIQKLEQINIRPSTVDEAEDIAAKSILSTLKLKVPITFGNIDLTIRGNQKKIDRRLTYLTNSIADLCKKSKLIDGYEIVTIGEEAGEGFLSVNGGLGGAVGNLIVYDEETKLLKFTDTYDQIKSNARTLLDKLNSKIKNLHLYRFDIKVMRFPKLVFDCADEAKDILSKLVIYEKQSNHSSVEQILQTQIEYYQRTNESSNFSVSSELMCVAYHHEIQHWWMSQDIAKYLTKTCDMYQQAANNIVDEQQLTLLQNYFYVNKLKYIGYHFNENSTQSLKSVATLSRAIVVSDLVTLTTVKVIQCLRSLYENQYTVVDFESVLNLPNENISALNEELSKTEKVLIIVCDVLQMKRSRAFHKRLDDLAHATEKKKIIVISNGVLLDIVKEYFLTIDNILTEENQSLTDLTPESRKMLLENAQVTFQGQEVGLDIVADDTSAAFVKGAVLNKIMRNESITVGASLSDSKYDEMKHLYIDRRVGQAPKEKVLEEDNNSVSEEDSLDDDSNSSEKDYTDYVHVTLRTFDDISEEVVLLTAAPGMGKSTLLTHLSLKTKEQDKTLWIVRINLLEHSKQFYEWQESETVIDTLETLKFLCRVVLKNSNMPICLKETNSKVYLESCTGDEFEAFELNMFLHFYNDRKLLLLFDGFDEICPHYKDTVIELLDVVINYPRKNKLWVTSRPYSEILPDLERVLGDSYELEYINDREQWTYVNQLWRTQLIFAELTDVQINNGICFLELKKDMEFVKAMFNFKFRTIYYMFNDYIHSHFPYIDANAYVSQSSEEDTLEQDSSWGNDSILDKDKEASSCDSSSESIQRVDKLLGTPLLLHLVANYFVTIISDGEFSNEWPIDISILTIYDSFIETKLKKILFEDKNRMDIYNPDIMTKYDKERRDCVTMHKKLGAYVIMGNPLLNKEVKGIDEFKDMSPFKEGDPTELDALIDKIKCGKEKNGFISYVTPDNVPVFVHKTIAEYFAAEYICDILKSSKFEHYYKKLLYNALCLLTTTVDVVVDFIEKRTEHDRELEQIIEDIESSRPYPSPHVEVFLHNHWPLEEHVRFMSSSLEDYDSGCFDDCDEDYLKNLMHIMEWTEIEQYALQFIKNIVTKMKPELRKYFTAWSTKDDAKISSLE